MNYIDILILLPLLWAVYKGFTKGFIIEVSSLIALILGIFLAINFSDVTKDILTNNLDIHSRYMSYIAFGITFILVVIAVNLIGKLISKLVHAIALGFINRLLGSAFSLAKCLIIICVIISIFESFDKKFHMAKSKHKQESILYYPIYEFGLSIYRGFDLEDLTNDISNKTKKI